MISPETLMLILDLAGTFVFAISGALAGVKGRFDIFGVVALSFVAGSADLYAVAALAGASVVVLGHLIQLPASACAAVGATLCFGLRFMAIRHGWRLPVARADE